MDYELYYEEEDENYFYIGGCVGKVYIEGTGEDDYFEVHCTTDDAVNSDMTKVGSTHATIGDLVKAARNHAKKIGYFD